MEPTTLDLFAGAGGMSLGFRAAGARCIGAVERNQAAADTFARTFDDERPLVFGGPDQGDVNKLPVSELLARLPSSPDIVVGGPPCQGFSTAGVPKQASLLGEEDRVRLGGVTDASRNLLYQYFLAVVRHARPLAFVMENVPGMRKRMGPDFAHRIAREAHSIGYNVRCFQLNAANYGVPQHRVRLFFVGLRSDLGVTAIPRPPPRTHEAPTRLEGTRLPEDPWLLFGDDIPCVSSPKPAVTVREAIGDLPKRKGHLLAEEERCADDEPQPPWQRLGQRPVEERLAPARQPSEYAQMLRSWPGLEAPETLSGNWYRFLGEKTGRIDYILFREMAQGDCYPDVLRIGRRLLREYLAQLKDPPAIGSKAYVELEERFVPGYRDDIFDDKWHKLIADQPSWTLPAHLDADGYSHIHYDSRQARTITIREAARLQSFPDAVEFCGNFGEQYTQIGNAVPPLLARAIASELFAQLSEAGAWSRQRAAG